MTVDVQNDFTHEGAAACVAGTAAVVPGIVRLLAAFRRDGLPIVHVVRLYAPDGSDAELSRREFIRTRGPVAAPDTPGAELVDALKPDPRVGLNAALLRRGERQRLGGAEWVAYKPRWGAFYETQLDVWLREVSVNTIVVCGCNFPNCPRATLVEASERDYRVVAVADALSQTSERGLREMGGLGIAVLTVDEVLAGLHVAPEPGAERSPA